MRERRAIQGRDVVSRREGIPPGRRLQPQACGVLRYRRARRSMR